MWRNFNLKFRRAISMQSPTHDRFKAGQLVENIYLYNIGSCMFFLISVEQFSGGDFSYA